MPVEARTPFFSHWITSYFKHGDLTTRDPKAISYVVPTTSRAPTIYSMSGAELARTIYEPSAFGSDMAFMIFCAPQIAATYHKAVFDKAVRALMPKMKVVVFSGDETASFSIPSQWAIEDDDKAAGGGFVSVKWVAGFNHLVCASLASALCDSCVSRALCYSLTSRRQTRLFRCTWMHSSSSQAPLPLIIY